MSDPVVGVHKLRKTYGRKVAVADVSFSVIGRDRRQGPSRRRAGLTTRTRRGAGGSRTLTGTDLNRVPLPVGLRPPRPRA